MLNKILKHAQAGDTVVHLGPGALYDDIQYGATQAQVVIAEPDPERAAVLRDMLAGKDNIDILGMAVTAAPGPASLHRYSYADANSLGEAGEALKQTYPGLRELAVVDVEAISVPDLLARLPSDTARRDVLVIDGIGEAISLLRGMGAAGALHRFSTIVVRAASQPLFDGRSDPQVIQDWLGEHWYDTAIDAGRGDDDFPVLGFRRNDRAQRLAEREAVAHAQLQERDAAQIRLHAIINQETKSGEERDAALARAAAELAQEKERAAREIEDRDLQIRTLLGRIEEREAGLQRLTRDVEEQARAADARLAQEAARAAAALVHLRERDATVAELTATLEEEKGRAAAQIQEFLGAVEREKALSARRIDEERLQAQALQAQIEEREAALQQTQQALEDERRASAMNADQATASVAVALSHLRERDAVIAELTARLEEQASVSQRRGAEDAEQIQALRAGIQDREATLVRRTAEFDAERSAAAARLAEEASGATALRILVQQRDDALRDLARAEEKARADLSISLRMQSLAQGDLKDLQGRFGQLLEEKGRQDILLRQVTQKLGEAARHVSLLYREEASSLSQSSGHLPAGAPQSARNDVDAHGDPADAGIREGAGQARRKARATPAKPRPNGGIAVREDEPAPAPDKAGRPPADRPRDAKAAKPGAVGGAKRKPSAGGKPHTGRREL